MIELTDLAEEHRWQVMEWRNNPDVARYMYQSDPIARDVHDAWFTRLLSAQDRQGWAIVMDGKPVGAAFVTEIDTHSRHASWAFYLADPDTRGRGVGSAVEYLVLEHAFTGLGLHKLCCQVLSFNQAVVSMHKKFGFVQEGLLREHWLRDGQWLDVHKLAMFEATWTERRAGFAEKLRARGLVA
jgi:UDP-4-amino-4,6-dideoxy-N-acetyl-beta-L-altrosamine N-acetyltransferase